MTSMCFVTGAAGFIGSALAERLLEKGYEVTGLDCFTDYYPRSIKERNLERLLASPGFRFVEADLCSADLSVLIKQVRYVLHLAAQPGVRSSWGRDFRIYTQCNVLATQRLLEAAKDSHIDKFVYASSSSVYGDTPDLPIREDSPLQPISPYGVTKLAGEHLCRLYQHSFGLPVVALRYFTVYGPRQRPDMAVHRFIKAIRDGETISVYGDGEQTRDFTFVSDTVEGTLLAMESDATDMVFNLGGGTPATVNRTLALLEKISGKRARVEYKPAQPGDVLHTMSDTSRARQRLGFAPKVGLEAGLEAEVAWLMAQGA